MGVRVQSNLAGFLDFRFRQLPLHVSECCLLLRLETVSQQLPESEAKVKLDSTIQQAADAIAEGRDAVEGLRTSIGECHDLPQAISSIGEELATILHDGRSSAFVLTVEGKPRDLHPLVRDDIYRISAEALRNAFRHAQADRIEVEIRYPNEHCGYVSAMTEKASIIPSSPATAATDITV